MGGFAGHLHRFRNTDVPIVDQSAEKMADDKEVGAVASPADPSIHTDSDTDKIEEDAQLGVQSIQAVTKVWTKNDIILAYITYASLPFQDGPL
jgi:hypothetical protein